MSRGIGVAVVVGLIVLGGIVSRYLRRRRHPVDVTASRAADPSDGADGSVEDVTRWEDEGGALGL